MKITERISKYAVGVIALGFLNLIGIVYDNSWLQIAVALDIAVVGAYLGVGLKDSKS